jgi:hypothetical protein
MAPVASSLASKLYLWIKIDDSFTTGGKILIYLVWVIHEITAGATCTKRATYKEQTTEFFEEASALNTNAAHFDLKKLILQGYVQLDDVHEHPIV